MKKPSEKKISIYIDKNRCHLVLGNMVKQVLGNKVQNHYGEKTLETLQGVRSDVARWKTVERFLFICCNGLYHFFVWLCAKSFQNMFFIFCCKFFGLTEFFPLTLVSLTVSV